jgi:hypothetical protein
MCTLRFKYYSDDIPISARQAFEIEVNQTYVSVCEALDYSQSYILVYHARVDRRITGIVITDAYTESLMETEGIVPIIEWIVYSSFRKVV